MNCLPVDPNFWVVLIIGLVSLRYLYRRVMTSIAVGELSLTGVVKLSPSSQSSSSSASTTTWATTPRSSTMDDSTRGNGRSPLLGREQCLLDPSVEERSVRDIIDTLTEEEMKQLTDPAMPIRHFRAEKGHVKNAAVSLRNALKWRKSFGVDRILRAMEGDDEEYRKMMLEENATGKIYVRGYDKEGRALVYMRPALENTHNELNNMRHLVWNLEKAVACTARKSIEINGVDDPPLEKYNLMIDYEGFKLKHSPPLSTTRFTLDILQKHYPERMYRAYILNPPLVFKVFWNLIKNFVDPITKEKIVFCSGKTGMNNLHQHMSTEGMAKLEAVAHGSAIETLPNFDSQVYLTNPFNVSFDE